MSYTLTVTDEIIRAALIITKEASSRTAFLIFENDGENAKIVATDGHIMGVFRLALPADVPSFSFALPSAAFASVAKKHTITLEIKDSRAVISQGAASYQCNALAVPFDWRRVITDTFSGEHAYFDPDLIYNFSKIAKILGRRLMPYVVPNGEEGAASVRIGENFFGIAMPFRVAEKGEGGYTSTPSWVR